MGAIDPHQLVRGWVDEILAAERCTPSDALALVLEQHINELAAAVGKALQEGYTEVELRQDFFHGVTLMQLEAPADGLVH